MPGWIKVYDNPAHFLAQRVIRLGTIHVFQNQVFVSNTLQEDYVGLEEVMDKARSVLVKAGIDGKNVKTIIEEGKQGVARDILNEQKRGEYDTVVIGRRGLSGTKAFFSGSVSNKIVQHAKDCAVWVVE